MISLVFVCCAMLLTSKSVLSTTSVPTLSPVELIGTPNAPTTPGGDCLNVNDYSERWTAVVKDELTGFDFYPTDVELCAEACAGTLGATQSEAYSCGGFMQPACPEDLPAICVQDCFLGTDKTPLTFPAVNVPGYTAECAYCFGELNQCTVTNCALPCVGGEPNEFSCQSCKAANCYDDFMACSGLNPTLKSQEVENPDSETQAPSLAPSATGDAAYSNGGRLSMWMVMMTTLLLGLFL